MMMTWKDRSSHTEACSCDTLFTINLTWTALGSTRVIAVDRISYDSCGFAKILF